jgi:hypothetical protein
MVSERPVSRHAARQMMDQIRAALREGVAQATIDFGGVSKPLRKVADGEFLLETPGRGDPTRIHAAPNQRPVGYPSEAPFIPGETVSFDSRDRTLSITWWGPDDAAAVLEDLHNQCLAAGWEPGGELRLKVLGVVQRAYAREATQRIVVHADSMLTLNDTTHLPQ